MLQINKGQVKYWYVTASEKKVGLYNIYLFYLVHRQTNKVFAFNLSNESSHTERYDAFYVDETRYNLYEGEYEYQIWDNENSNNLNPANCLGLLEKGILKVNLVELAEVFYTPQ